MSFLSHTYHLFRKETALEFRQLYALGGVLLYVASTAFVVYSAMGEQVPKMVWAALFWIVVLFASVNALAKSFMQESSGRQLYYYTLASPTTIILSKILYNALLLWVIEVLCYGVFSLIMGNPLHYPGLFWAAMSLAAPGFSIAFTFLSSIASKARQSATLMAILSLPVVIPMLLTLMRLSKIALALMHDSAYYKDMLILLSIDGILMVLVLLLFPYLWRD